jgi:uncharacterized UPF0160 family protein
MFQLTRTKKILFSDYFTDEIVPRISREQSLSDQDLVCDYLNDELVTRIDRFKTIDSFAGLISSLFKDLNKILNLAKNGGAWEKGWEELFLKIEGYLGDPQRAQAHFDWVEEQILNGFQFNELEKTYLGYLSKDYCCFEDAAKQMAEARKKCLRFSKV